MAQCMVYFVECSIENKMVSLARLSYGSDMGFACPFYVEGVLWCPLPGVVDGKVVLGQQGGVCSL